MSTALPFFAEEDLLQDAHLTVSLGEFLCAVGSRGDQAASQGQGSWGRPGHPLFHGVMGEPTSHLKCLPVHHQLSFGGFPKVLNLVDVDCELSIILSLIIRICFKWFTDNDDTTGVTVYLDTLCIRSHMPYLSLSHRDQNRSSV